MTALLVLLELAALLLVMHPADCRAGNISASSDRVPEASRRGDNGKERRREREKRFIVRALDDLKGSRALAVEEMKAVEKEIDAITLLESPQRERDFSDLLDWYYDYDGWLTKAAGDFEDDLALLSAGPAPADGRWRERYDGLGGEQDALARELEKRVKRYDAEEKRLAGIIELRRELQERFGDLESRLAQTEGRLGELPASAPERREGERKAEKFRAEIKVVQNELLSLPLVDEDILKHYAVLAERGHGEIDWLSLKRAEYDTMRDLAATTALPPRRDAAAIETAYRQAVRQFESEINRLSRTKDELDRKRSRVTPAGSLKEVERSRELSEFYERLQGRYDREIGRLRVLIGACDAELADALSEK